jgi:hypothetical protein
MARKIRGFSDEIVQKVITLRTAGYSWMKIQKEVGIDRRTAKRVYEQWEHNQAKEELKAARQNVAAEEFRNHMQSLVKLEQSLFEVLTVPKMPSERRKANELLLQLWERDIGGEYGAYGLPGAKAETRYMVRQNQLIFKSLQVHTQGKVDWRAMGKWEESWNQCVSALVEFETAGHKILQNILEQKPDLKTAILKETDRKDMTERILKGILYIVWQYVLDDRMSKTFPLVKIAARSDGQTEILFGKNNLSQGIIFRKVKLATELVEVSKWAAKNLSKENSVENIAREIDIMQKQIDELRESLNPLVLRPLIFHTRCDLCPA